MHRTIITLGFMIIAFVYGSPAKASVTILSNGTNKTIDFQIGTEPPEKGQLLPYETKPIACSRPVTLTYLSEGQSVPLKIQPYSAYVFIAKRDKLELHGIMLSGKLPPVPNKTIVRELGLKIPVKILVDDSERRTRRLWEPDLRKRLERASAILESHAGVSFEAVAFEEWDAKPTTEITAMFEDFEKTVKPSPGLIAIAYTSRVFTPPSGQGPDSVPLAVTRNLFGSHMLVRENAPRNESERVEVLVQQLGKYLGAVPTPDPLSAMRTKLGDGKAAMAKFRIGFDPLNTLAMNIWAESLKKGKTITMDELPEISKARLGCVYATLSSAMPDTPLPEDYAALVARVGGEAPAAVVAAAPAAPAPAANAPAAAAAPVVPAAAQAEMPAKADPAEGQAVKPLAKVERARSPREEAARRVVRAVALRAEDNSRKPASGADARLKGDALTELLIRTAADVAMTEEKEMRVTAFLIGLGIALDDSTILRSNPLTSSLCDAVESEEERRRRLAVLGMPTLRFRRDLCQHFVISATLTEIAGETVAEQAGLAKELIDMNRASGFSFVDLAADMTGVEFAKKLRTSKFFDLEGVARDFKVVNFVPSIEDLPEGLPAATFKARFGSITDPRFQTQYDDIRRRVSELRNYR